jgi:hypothetical protein
MRSPPAFAGERRKTLRGGSGTRRTIRRWAPKDPLPDSRREVSLPLSPTLSPSGGEGDFNLAATTLPLPSPTALPFSLSPAREVPLPSGGEGDFNLAATTLPLPSPTAAVLPLPERERAGERVGPPRWKVPSYLPFVQRPPRLLALLYAVLATLPGCRDATLPRAPADAAAAVTPARLDLAAWTRMDPASFGCWMQRSLGRRDPLWSCASRRAAATDTDPCSDPAAFYAGPELPDDLAPRLHPLLRSVDLTWEGGALQRATFVFAPGVAPAEMARILRADGRLGDVASAGPGECDGPCYDVEVFEAADDACDGEGDEGDGT